VSSAPREELGIHYISRTSQSGISPPPHDCKPKWRRMIVNGGRPLSSADVLPGRGSRLLAAEILYRLVQM
jgi:hypothetical protein